MAQPDTCPPVRIRREPAGSLRQDLRRTVNRAVALGGVDPHGASLNFPRSPYTRIRKPCSLPTAAIEAQTRSASPIGKPEQHIRIVFDRSTRNDLA